jgi:recombination protein RecT
MAIKTMLRQLISKWGVMSIEFQKANEADMGIVREDNSIEYVDNVEDEPLVLDPVTDPEIVVDYVVDEGTQEAM